MKNGGLRRVNRLTRNILLKNNSEVSTSIIYWYMLKSVADDNPVSRVMVHLFSRLTRLLACVHNSDLKITEIEAPGDVTLAPSQPGSGASTPTPQWVTSLITTCAPTSTSRGTSPDPIIMEARRLNSDVDAWIGSLRLATLEHERVQVGNRAYAYSMKVGQVPS